MDSRPHVVVVGGGFGGLAAARGLGRAPVDVTLVDRTNHHLFQPLLYQVATAGLSPADIASPDPPHRAPPEEHAGAARRGHGASTSRRGASASRRGSLPYDYLVLATGATHSYFGKDEWERHAPGLKSLEDALEIRRRMLLAFEQAERETDREAVRQWLTFVVIGGGPTGVEMAGAFAEIARHTLARDFRRIDPRMARVILVEAGPRLLAAYTEDLSEKAKTQLEDLGVQVWTGAAVTGVDESGVDVGNDRVAARTVVWGAGRQGLAPRRGSRGPRRQGGARARRPRTSRCPATPRCS